MREGESSQRHTLQAKDQGTLSLVWSVENGKHGHTVEVATGMCAGSKAAPPMKRDRRPLVLTLLIPWTDFLRLVVWQTPPSITDEVRKRTPACPLRCFMHELSPDCAGRIPQHGIQMN